MANLREEYTQHIHNTAPDMDKLWNRISDEIDRKETKKQEEQTAEKNREQIKRSGGYMRIAAVAAAFIVVFAGVNIMNESKKTKTARESIPLSRPDRRSEENADNADNTADDEKDGLDNNKGASIGAAEEAAKADDMADTDNSVKYEQLSFNATDTKPFVAAYKPGGDEFFVEDRVLSETDLFVDVMVIGADLSDEGGAEYSLMVNCVYYREDGASEQPGDIPSTIKLRSTTPYILQENRQYLIPLKKGAGSGEYSIVFENAPQIELTLDGGAVFQNGWTALDNGSQTLEKESLSVNDFYFDRMKYTPYFDINELITEWNNA